MKRLRFWRRGGPMVGSVGLLGLMVLAAGAAYAQDPATPPPVRPDTVPAVRPDTVPADSQQVGPPPDPAAEAVASRLRKLQGYVTTEYKGENAVYDAAEGVLRLQGTASVARAGDRLTADTIVYRERSELVEAYGSPKVAGQAQELEGNVLFYDLARRRATALGARTQVSEGATWHVRGDVTLEGASHVYASHGAFTTCDLEIPHYHFESDKILVVKDKLLVARPARLYFGKVPVMWLPFVVQNLEQGRRSGLLIPKFSINDIVRTSSGYTRQISDLGWYWAINDYLGAQITGSWRSEAYTSLQGTLDYRWRRQFLDGRFSFRQYWQDAGNKTFNFSGNTSWKPDERTSLALNASYAQSARFIRDISIDPREVTQDMTSTFRVNRRFDWGTVALGADRRQSIADGSVRGTLPSFSINPKTFTLFRATTEAEERWYSNTSVQVNLSGRRTFEQGQANVLRGIQDQTTTQLQGGLQQFSIGKFNLSATGSLNQRVFQDASGLDTAGVPISLPERRGDEANWQASLSYQQELIGQTILSPNISLSQEIRRDSLSHGGFLGGPTRMNVGAALSTAVFGFFPGVGPYSAIRHRLSPSMSYYYSPRADLSDLQRQVFGGIGGLAQNRVSLTLNQTFEAKLKEPRRPREDTLASDTAGADTTSRRESTPAQPEKVTLLSISTSPVQYDFVLADSTGNGFVTDRISNTISSDYLKGLTIQMQHELFDKSALDPDDPTSRGKLGTFAPRLSSLSTGFELGPSSAVVELLSRVLGVMDPQEEENPATQGAIPGNPPSGETNAPGQGAFTGNPQGTGAGPWRVSLQYSFSRPPRTFSRSRRIDDRPIQTVGANMSFSLTPNWAVSWNTDYSISDGEFGSHRLNFKRDLHRWQANFNFYKTPNGNAAFEFYVELTDNRDLKFDYRERNLGIDRR